MANLELERILNGMILDNVRVPPMLDGVVSEVRSSTSNDRRLPVEFRGVGWSVLGFYTEEGRLRARLFVPGTQTVNEKSATRGSIRDSERELGYEVQAYRVRGYADRRFQDFAVIGFPNHDAPFMETGAEAVERLFDLNYNRMQPPKSIPPPLASELNENQREGARWLSGREQGHIVGYIPGADHSMLSR
tara:strand:- start:398 stop:967 length:570 start_codon:yes stop_codon:yes gene_type:complete